MLLMIGKSMYLLRKVEDAYRGSSRSNSMIIGIEGGGHGASSGSPVLTLVSSILSAVPEPSPPILAAGGMVNGGHLAALLILGASGAVFGTRFLVSPESLYTDVQRRALVAASSSSSVRTMAFDHARGTTGWPRGIDGRGLRNSQYFCSSILIQSITFHSISRYRG